MAFPVSLDTFHICVNNLTFSLTADYVAADPTIFVNSTTGAPTAGSFHLGSNIIYYTGKTANSFTGCTGGNDGTADVGYAMVSGGNEVVFGPEAHNVNDLNTAETATQAKVGIDGSAVTTSHDYKLSGVTAAAKAFSDANVIDEDNMVSDLDTKVPTQQSVKAYTDTSIATLKTALKANHIICMAAGFNINGSSATLVDTAGTADKCYAQHISALKTDWFDFPKFIVPLDYNGGDIDITVAWRCAAASKKHSLGIRVASVPTGSPYNPDLAAAFQLYNEEISDATIGDVTIKTVTVTQANHGMVAGQIWHCKFVVEDDAGCDADATLFDFIDIKWNKV